MDILLILGGEEVLDFVSISGGDGSDGLSLDFRW